MYLLFTEKILSFETRVLFYLAECVTNYVSPLPGGMCNELSHICIFYLKTLFELFFLFNFLLFKTSLSDITLYSLCFILEKMIFTLKALKIYL